MTLKDARETAKSLKPMLHIGKFGITPAIVTQLKAMIHKHKIVKVKLLHSFVDAQQEEGVSRKELAQELATKTNSMLIDRVGFVVVLAKQVKPQS